MNDTQKLKVKELRGKGYSYGKIAKALNLSENTIKTHCRRHGLAGVADVPETVDGDNHYCLCCGALVAQNSGRKEKKFCSDQCRMKWWNSHLDQVQRKATYEFVCPVCKKPFTAYGNKNRKYCSHKCYILGRFGSGRLD